MTRYARFLAAGLPSALLALPLNLALVELARWPKPGAYAAVLVFQVCLNYVLCRHFVFPRSVGGSEISAFSGFALVVGSFRLLDWAVYAYLVNRIEFWYGWLQILNLAAFSVMKYFACKFVFRPAP